MIGQIIAAGAAYLGQSEANRNNRDIANQANAFNAAQTKEQMAFQERMSNTAHQRQIKDLEAAGLNPLLSATSGAASPSGASASAQTATMQDELGGAATSALDAYRASLEAKKLAQELRNMKADEENTFAATETAKKLGKVHDVSAKQIQQNMTIKKPTEEVMGQIKNLIDKTKNEIKNPSLYKRLP